MPGRSQHSGRVVIMDDVAWSEPAPRGRRATSELDPPAWIQAPESDPAAPERLDDVGGLDESRPAYGRPSRPTDSRAQPVRRHDGRRYERRDVVEPDFREGDFREGDFRERDSPEPGFRGRDRDLAAPDRSRADRRPAVGRFHAEDYLDERNYAAEAAARHGWDTTPSAEPVVLEYTDSDEEEIWGPRPKLLATEAGGRRTVVITGRGGDRAVVPRSNPRENLPVHARHGFPADRTAMWAVLLCVIVLLAAVASH